MRMWGQPSRAMVMGARLSRERWDGAPRPTQGGERMRTGSGVQPLPRLAGDGLHAVLQVQLLLLEGGLLDLLLVAQDGLLGQGHEAALVLVVLLVQPAVLVVLHEETVLYRSRVLGHRHLLAGGMKDGQSSDGHQARRGNAPEPKVPRWPGLFQGSSPDPLRTRAKVPLLQYERVLARVRVVPAAHGHAVEAEGAVEPLGRPVALPH